MPSSRRQLEANRKQTLVRDLWALRIHKLTNRVSYDSETDTEGQSQMFSSQSEGETSASEASRRSKRRSRVRTDGAPNMRETLSLCYTGMLLLREPVTVADIFAWATDGKLPYYRAAREVPMGMRERLPATYQELLEPQHMAQPQKLHQATYELLSMFSSGFGMALPPLNGPLILLRWVKELALPIEVYAATQRLARVLDLSFAFAFSAKARSSDAVLRHPEVRLMALVAVATKLFFPFDDIKRYPASATELSALSLRWSTWTKVQSRVKHEARQVEGLGYEGAMGFSQKDAVEAADEQLDAYMDWFEHNVASEDVREHGQGANDADFRKALFRLFPAGRDESQSQNARSHSVEEMDITDALQEVQSSLRPKRVVETTETGKQVTRIGSFYRRHRTAEELNGAVRLFYERASALAGVSLDAMARAVFLIEKKIQERENRLRRTASGSDSGE